MREGETRGREREGGGERWSEGEGGGMEGKERVEIERREEKNEKITH